MRKWKKPLSLALAVVMMVPLLTTNVFALYVRINSRLYESTTGNQRQGQYSVLNDPGERDKFNDSIFATGGPGSAVASGYGAFDIIWENTSGIGYEYSSDNVKPTGHIKWVLHDGVLIVTNDLTNAEIEAEANAAENPDRTRRVLTTFDVLNASLPYLELTPFRNNPYIETVIFGDNIDYWNSESVFVNCSNLKNVIIFGNGNPSASFTGDKPYGLVAGSDLDYSIVNVGGEPLDISVEIAARREFIDDEDRDRENHLADYVAYHSDNSPFNGHIYTPVSKGSVTIGESYFETTYKDDGYGRYLYYNTFIQPDTTTVAAQYAEAKSYVEDMDLPDWVLAFLPVEMGGTGTARTVDDVFDFNTASLKSNWNDGSNTGTVTETPVTEPETPVVSTEADEVTYSDWAAEDIITAIRMGYLDDDPDVFGYQPAVTDLLGSDYTRAITRGQFAALAVRYYETLMSDITGEDYTIPVNSGDDVFADSTGDTNMAKAYNLGIMGGYNSADTRAGVYVGPNDLITREQAATMLTRLMEQLIEAFDDAGRTGWTVWYADDLPFVDEIADWAYDGVRAVYGVGAMTGTSGTTFSAQSPYTIEQSIVTIMRIDGNWARAGRG